MAKPPSPPPFDPELDSVDTMPLGNVLQSLVSKHDDAYVTGAGLIFRERLKTLIRMDRARQALLDLQDEEPQKES